jgi:iron complex outermembrane receptor protein
MKRVVFFLSLLLLSALTRAQTDTTELQPVEVKSLRAGATAPFTKTNIKKPDIEKQNLGQDLPFLLNQTPSVVVNSDAGNGVGYTGIRIRGTDATRINVTLNGIPFNDAESQGTFFVDLPDFLSSVNSIQIQRGAGTSSNGAGAFGGTINLSTNEVNKKAYAELNNSYGSFNTWKNTIKAGSGLLAKHFTTDVRLSRIASDGYIDRANSNLKSLYFSTACLSDKTNLRFNLITGKEKTYQAWYGVSEADLKTSRTINYAGMEKTGEPYDNQTDNYTQSHYQLFFDHRWNPNLIFNTAVFFTKGKGYYEEYKAGQRFSDYGLTPAAGSSSTDLVRQRWLDNNFFGDIFSLQYHAAKTQLTLGGAVTRYTGSHFGKVVWAQKGLSANNRYYDLDAQKNDFNIYGKWQQNITEKWQWFTDLQWRRIKHHIEGFENNPGLFIDQAYNFFNPKAGISYHVNNLLAYASYSIAHKEPNRDDFEASAQQLPRPEKLHDIEAGIEDKNAKRSWSAVVYYMRYKDQLVLSGKINDVGAYTRTNIDKSYRIGLELQGSVVINSWLQAVANLTLSRNRISDFTEFIDDYDNGDQKINTYKQTDISFSPNFIGSGSIILTPIKSLELDFLSKYVSKQYLDNTQNDNRKLKAYFTEDVRAVYPVKNKWLKNASIIAQVNNVFNRKYEPNGYTFSYYTNNSLTTENYYYPMAGTNFMVGLNIKL